MRAIRHEGGDPEGWAERIARARAEVAAARTLDGLAAVLNGGAVAALPLEDLVALPSFGGDRPDGNGVFSWDASRILVMSPFADGFAIESR
jgi:hypothetical protein